MHSLTSTHPRPGGDRPPRRKLPGGPSRSWSPGPQSLTQLLRLQPERSAHREQQRQDARPTGPGPHGLAGLQTRRIGLPARPHATAARLGQPPPRPGAARAPGTDPSGRPAPARGRVRPAQPRPPPPRSDPWSHPPSAQGERPVSSRPPPPPSAPPAPIHVNTEIKSSPGAQARRERDGSRRLRPSGDLSAPPDLEVRPGDAGHPKSDGVMAVAGKIQFTFIHILSPSLLLSVCVCLRLCPSPSFLSFIPLFSSAVCSAGCLDPRGIYRASK